MIHKLEEKSKDDNIFTSSQHIKNDNECEIIYLHFSNTHMFSSIYLLKIDLINTLFFICKW